MKSKEWLIVLGVVQLGVASPFDGTIYMAIFGMLSLLWVIIGTFDMWEIE